jgi:hypothetical protein
MLRKLYVTLTILFVGTALSYAQTGTLKGKILDKGNNETIPFANVIIEANGNQVGATTSNIDGEYTIKPIPPGNYTVKATYVGYQTQETKGVTIKADQTTYVDVKLTSGVQNLDEVEVVVYQEPLIDPDTKSGGTVTREEYQNMPSKNINSIAATTAGVYQGDEGSELSVRGTRSNATEYYIDGQRVIGGSNLPEQSVEQVTVITGGVPAQYGDATGGVIAISTRGPQSEFFGGAQYETSQFLDAFGHHSFNFTLGGPILMKKDSTGYKQSILGYIVSGQAIYDKDPDPSAIGGYKINDDTLKWLEENPLRPSELGGFVRNSEYVRMDDLEKIKARQNVASKSFLFNGKIDYKPTSNMNITLGGSADYTDKHGYVYMYSMFNPSNNPQVIDNTWRAYAKLTQKFGTQNPDDKTTSNIKNAYYTLQVSYTNYKQTVQDDTHGDNLFNYGYIGRFHQYKEPYFAFRNGPNGQGYYQAGYTDTLLTFTPASTLQENGEFWGTPNYSGENYTEQFYNFTGADNVVTGTQVQQGLGLLNGDNASSVYSIWNNTGRQYNAYSKIDNSQFRVFTNFSADIKDHAIQLGFEYEQRSNRYYYLDPINLWGLMRQLTNYHIQEIDTAGTPQFYSGGTYNYWTFDRRNDLASQKEFDRNLRTALGLDPNGTDYIDVDAYDPSTFSLEMFSADDLLNDGNGAGGYNGSFSYYGFDHAGNKLTSNPSFDDFFTAKDEAGNFKREIGAYQPIYVAGYIQDKFDFRDLKFNVGVRVDRFDANQKVLKDRYLLYESKTVGETGTEFTHPGNMGSDYVVYVNDAALHNQVVGYRNGDTWYDASGVEIADPSVLAEATTTGRITPYLVDPNNTTISSKVFKDYDPQITVMPRIAFSFPISDQANFFAHYDVLTQRPPERNRLDPTDYLYIQNSVGALLNNPDLKPERTTDYELGFSQVLSEKKNSSITISAFYRELRDMIQVVRINEAYPVSYLTMGNIDFGTVKGFSVAYDLRRTGPVSLNASYTLQFADGTGSGATEGYNLASAGQPNLRNTMPLDFDQRHTIVTNIDYRFGSGKTYHGPTWTRHKGKDNEKAMQLFANMGANILLNAGSGVPYTKQANVTPEGLSGVQTKSQMKGSLNGAQLPWTFRMDLRLDKDVELAWGGKDGEDKKLSNLNIYLQVLNVLNAKNIQNVYRFTGNPDDDGYLAAAESQSSINAQNDPQSFRDLYSIKVNNPSNYSIPRRIRIGAILEF